MVWLERGNPHLPQHPTEPQIESARLTAIHLGWIRELIRRNVQNLDAAGRTAPSHMNAQPFLRGNYTTHPSTNHLYRRSTAGSSRRSAREIGAQTVPVSLQTGELFIRGIGLAGGRARECVARGLFHDVEELHAHA